MSGERVEAGGNMDTGRFYPAALLCYRSGAYGRCGAIAPNGRAAQREWRGAYASSREREVTPSPASDRSTRCVSLQNTADRKGG